MKAIGCLLQERRYLFASLGILFVVAIVDLVPLLTHNEAIYLVRPRRIVDPEFLQHDWSYGSTSRPTVTAFWALGAALFLVLRENLSVALIGRVLAWTAVIYSFGRLSKELGLGWYAFLLGMCMWFLTGQSLAAGEWVLGGVEQKVFAYGLLALALTALLRREGFRAGLFCGMVIAFHILVGGWGAVALAAAALASTAFLGRRTVMVFFASATIVGLPFLCIALYGMTVPADPSLTVPAGANTMSMLVLFRNPHHLDPDVFFTRWSLVKLVVMGACTLYAIRATVSRDKARILAVFLSAAVGLFLMGLIARPLGIMHLLYVYPFRLADALLPLFFWLVGMEFVWRTARSLWQRPREEGRPRPWPLLVSACFAITAIALGRDAVPYAVRGAKGFAWSWSEYLSQNRTPFDAMTIWIRENTDPSATVAAPPCHADFMIKSERGAVVSFKSSRSGRGANEWYRRLQTLNAGRQFTGVGFEVCDDLEANFSLLDAAQLGRVRQDYSADYYLTMQERRDLASRPVHRNGTYYLYDLRLLGD